jgi:Fe-S cluster biogenesis protein NfuA
MGDVLSQSSRRVETLLDRFSAFPPASGARADAEELVRVVSSLYGECLRHMLNELRTQLDTRADEVVERWCVDPLVASLLITHGLHPVALAERVRRALNALRPALETKHAAVEVLSADEDAVCVRIDGTADVVPLVEQAIRNAAPEVLDVRTVGQTISLLSVR